MKVQLTATNDQDNAPGRVATLPSDALSPVVREWSGVAASEITAMWTALILAVIILAPVTLAVCGLAALAREWLDCSAPPPDSLDEACNEMFPTADPAQAERRPQSTDER